MTSREKRNLATGLFFVSPWLLGFLIFSVYPIAAGLYYSFCHYNIVRPPRWIGFANYIELFTDDPSFYKSLFNTFYMTAIGLPLGLVFAFSLALVLNVKVKGQSFFRTAFYLPSIVPVVATSILWLWILNPEYGLVNALLHKFALKGPGWLTDPHWSKPSLILTGLWGVGGTMIIFLAGLQQIPGTLYEAALVDGAGRRHRLLHVTLPSVSPVIFFNVIMGIIGSFQYFTQVYVMTGGGASGRAAGGPERSTLVYALYLYQNAFSNFAMGYASAMAWILFVIVALLVAVVIRSGYWVHYGEQ
jgi:multiple sugar transport system permease protein